jgi:outer membrane lipoprotein-sorting protein
MINRRTTVLTGLVTGLSLGLARTMPARAQAQLTAQDRADLGKIEDYLNGIHSLKASFAQTAPDGNVTHGVTIMQRPGRMRFQYDPPAPFLLVANYGVLFFHDSQLNQTTNIPLSRTPLGILLADRASLSGDVTVTRFTRLPGTLEVTLVRTASPGEGSLTLIFNEQPLTLRQWVVLDQQGKQTRVTFTNMQTGVALDAKQFDYRALAPGGTSGGG